MSANRKPLTKIVEPDEQELSLRAIEILPDQFQTRARIDPEIVKVYSKAIAKGSVFPPVVVFKLSDGRLILADGFHRVEAHRKLGLRSIRSVVRGGTADDAILFGLEANFAKTNIRKVSREDRSHAAEVMIRNERLRSWSNAAIGKRCGMSGQTIHSIRLRLRDGSGIGIPERVIQFHRDGRPTGVTVPYHRGAGKRVKQQATSHAALGSVGGFQSWLASNQIHSQSRGPGTLGGRIVVNHLLIPVPGSSADPVLKSIGIAALARVETEDLGRVILVGYFSSDPYIGRILNLASRLAPPIEFMTPEELVVEFGRKGGTAVLEPEAAEVGAETPSDDIPGKE